MLLIRIPRRLRIVYFSKYCQSITVFLSTLNEEVNKCVNLNRKMFCRLQWNQSKIMCLARQQNEIRLGVNDWNDVSKMVYLLMGIRKVSFFIWPIDAKFRDKMAFVVDNHLNERLFRNFALKFTFLYHAFGYSA